MFNSSQRIVFTIVLVLGVLWSISSAASVAKAYRVKRDDILPQVLTQLNGVAQTALDAVDDVTVSLDPLLNTVTSITGLTQVLKPVLDLLPTLVDTITDTIGGLLNTLLGRRKRLLDVGSTTDALLTTVNGIVSSVDEVTGSVIKITTSSLTTVKDELIAIIDEIKNLLDSTTALTLPAVQGLVQKATQTINKLVGSVVGIEQEVTESVGDLTNKVKAVLDNVTKALGQISTLSVTDATGPAIKSIQDIVGKIGKVTDSVDDTLFAVTDAANDVTDKLLAQIQTILGSLTKFLTDNAGNLVCSS